MAARKAANASSAATQTSPASAPAVVTAKAVEETISATKESVEGVVKDGQEIFLNNIEEAVTMSKSQMDDFASKWFKGFGDVSEFQAGNMDALVTATTTAMKAGEALTKTAFELSKSSMDKSVEATKMLMAAKTPKEVFDLQSSLAKATLDDAVVEGNKLSEMTMKLTNDVVAPLQERATIVVEKVLKAA